MQNTIKKERLQMRLAPEIEEFKKNNRTLQIATVSKDGMPNVSYSPFILLENNYYILISTIARHTRNLLHDPRLSFMIIEDEQQSKKIYARKRLTFDANATLIQRDSMLWKNAIEALQTRFGDIINDLSNFSDFSLFQLKPNEGLYVKGFGKAYEVSANNSIDFVHLDKGHQNINAQ